MALFKKTSKAKPGTSKSSTVSPAVAKNSTNDKPLDTRAKLTNIAEDCRDYLSLEKTTDILKELEIHPRVGQHSWCDTYAPIDSSDKNMSSMSVILPLQTPSQRELFGPEPTLAAEILAEAIKMLMPHILIAAKRITIAKRLKLTRGLQQQQQELRDIHKDVSEEAIRELAT